MTPQTFKMENPITIINDFKPLTIVAKFSVVAAVGILATPLFIEERLSTKFSLTL